jgi:acetyl-CoA carboxylase/biotin carboxylase 1
MPTFKNLATHFAALHDTPGVMLHKRAIREIVPWKDAREFFASRLRMRVAEERVKEMVLRAAPVTTAGAYTRSHFRST